MNIRIARPKNRPMFSRRLIILKSHNNLKRADRNPVGSVEGMTAQTSDEAFLHLKMSHGDEKMVGETVHKELANNLTAASIFFLLSIRSRHRIIVSTLALSFSFTCLLPLYCFFLYLALRDKKHVIFQSDGQSEPRTRYFVTN